MAANQSQRPRPSFPVPIRTQPNHSSPTTNTSMSISPENRLQLQFSQSTFKGPQHKHAHHLHSIPPREKTTRTLILDHMLWLHARARFAQARAELGMNPAAAGDDHDEGREYMMFGGPNYDGGDECMSPIMEWTGGNGKDAVSARAFKARADGLEKVLSAMLEQPPEQLPFDADDLLFRDTSFAVPEPPQLPNGVRLRLALAALINDVFADDDCTVVRTQEVDTFAPYYHSPQPPLSTYTPALTALSRFSSYAHHTELPIILPPFHAFAATAESLGSDMPPAQSILPPPAPPAGSIFSSIPRGAGPESPWALGGSLGRQSSSAGAQSGSFPSSSSPSSMMPPPPPPPAPRNGPRYSTLMPLDMAPPPPRVFRAVGRSRDLYNAGTYARATGSSNRPHRCPHHLTYACPPSSFCINSLATQSPIKTSKSRTRSSIGAGLSSSGPPLRRSAYSGKNRGKDSRMTDLLPRFLRLSALVAVELGREARNEEERAEQVARMSLGKRKEGFGRAGAGSAAETAMSSDFSYDSDDDDFPKRGHSKVVANPTKLWYRLLAGLLTRAALQGYLVKGWKGTDAIEVLLGLGIGGPPVSQPDLPNKAPRYSDRAAMQSAIDGSDDDDDDDDDDGGYEPDDKEYEPDDMPELNDVWHILFGVKPKDAAVGGAAREAFDDYERIMGERISEFFTISPNCSDLSIHLDDLAHKYPSQPVDHAVLRFCEAVAKWRGRPELETVSPNYKSRPSEPPTPTTTNAAHPSSSSASLSIHSLIHPQPPARPLIERYFSVPSKAEREAVPSGWEKPVQRRDSMSPTGTKRSRRNSWSNGKGKKVFIDQAYMEDDEYVGPYGI